MTDPVQGYKDRAERKKNAEEARALLPEGVVIELARGAVLVMDPLREDLWRWTVRWPAPHEKDPLLAAGGYRYGETESATKAEKAGRLAFEGGPDR